MVLKPNVLASILTQIFIDTGDKFEELKGLFKRK